jgi:restriction system protein
MALQPQSVDFALTQPPASQTTDEIAPQRIGEFLRIIFVRLWSERSGLPAGELLDHVAQATPLSQAETEFLPATRTPRFERTIRLATIPFLKAGWLVKNKGRWSLTEEGKRACRSFPTAEAFYREAGRIYEEWRQGRSLLSLLTEEAEERSWEQVHTFLQGMSSYEFQVLAGDLLLAMGYHLVWVAPPEKERGLVNFVFNLDSLGLNIPRIKVHVLHNGQAVMLEGMKAFVSVLGPDDAGIYISSGGFTQNAIEEAQSHQPYRITLIDLENFFDLWIEYYDQLSPEAQRRFPLKPVYFLSSLD